MTKGKIFEGLPLGKNEKGFGDDDLRSGDTCGRSNSLNGIPMHLSWYSYLLQVMHG